MHAALRLTETLAIVCEFLGSSTLAHLARTCRTFKEPALDVLWKVLPELYPLVNLLPDSTWEFDSRHHDGLQ